MIIKVCGINDGDNFREISQCNIDMIGLNFYSKSKRYVNTAPINFANEHGTIKRVGVFVDEDMEFVKHRIKEYSLDMIQLHGNETAEYVKDLSGETNVIKVFHIDAAFNFSDCEFYDSCSYYLFDTSSAAYGGTGKKFDWSLIESYKAKTPFILAGGISPDDLEMISQIRHPRFSGIDINSKFEIEPGIKNVELVKHFAHAIKLKDSE